MTTLPMRRTVRCPACSGPSEYSPENPWRPFCCERCKNHDFGAWATESYRVADTATPDSEADGDNASPRH